MGELPSAEAFAAGKREQQWLAERAMQADPPDPEPPISSDAVAPGRGRRWMFLVVVIALLVIVALTVVMFAAASEDSSQKRTGRAVRSPVAGDEALRRLLASPTPTPERAGAAAATAIVPGRSIGPVGLGNSASEVRRALASERYTELVPDLRWSVPGGGEITVTIHHGEVVDLSTDSPIYEIDGVGTDTDLSTLRRRLRGWLISECPDGSATARLDSTPDGPTTQFQFFAGQGAGRASLQMSKVLLQAPCSGE